MARNPVSKRPAVTVNPWFLLVLAVYAFSGQARLMAMAFAVVTLHELAHVVMAQSFGLPVERIEIWPFGGFAQIPGLEAQDPYVETMVVMVGPFQHFLLAAGAWGLHQAGILHGMLLQDFITLNLGLGLVNLLPVAPLDGGRLARIFWSRKIGYGLAEKRVKKWGQVLAIGLMALALATFLWGRPQLNIAIFAFFLWWGASRRAPLARFWAMRDLMLRKDVLSGRALWILEDLAVRSDTPVSEVLDMLRPMRYYRVLVVTQELQKMGTLYEEDLLQAFQEYGPHVAVGRLIH
ncbi:MAG: site-2 protease family protein [Firmicutes bacterium]|nr:site-2 protease family protein [Bacillota bacterium]